MKRRDFLASTALTAAYAALPLRLRLPRAEGAAPKPAALPFDLARVRLGAGPFKDALDVNRRFLMAQDPDRLLHTFRLTAGLPSSAEPLGGWEAPENELRGHYTGHYLSACALMAAQTGDAEIRVRGEQIVAELAKCQQANGYLSAFPQEFFDRLRLRAPVWAPFYTLHKIMAGLLDTAQLSGNAQALQVLQGMARWTAGWCQPLGDYDMQRVLEREYGGMNEVLYNLSARHRQRALPLACAPVRPRALLRPAGRGARRAEGPARQHQHPQGDRRGAALRADWATSATGGSPTTSGTRSRSTARYATGGTTNGEGWETDPDVLAAQLTGYTQEYCTTYNMLKLTRHLFGWTADAAAADYYERALFNGILGSQHPADGEKLYYVSLATRAVEAVRHADPGLLVLHRDDERGVREARRQHLLPRRRAGLWVNLFIASEVDWSEKGVRVTQETAFPASDRIGLTVHCRAAHALRAESPRAVLGRRRERRDAERTRARGVRGAVGLLRPRAHLARRRPARGAAPDEPACASDAGRPDARGHDVRPAGPRRPARHRRPHAVHAARAADQAAQHS